MQKSKKPEKKSVRWENYFLGASAVIAVSTLSVSIASRFSNQEAPAAVPSAASSAKASDEQLGFISKTGIWAEPYRGKIAKDENGNFYMAGRLLVNFERPVTKEAVEELTSQYDGRVTGHLPKLDTFEVEVNDLEKAINHLNKTNAEAKRNYYFKVNEWDNDTYNPGTQDLNDGLWWSEKIELSKGLERIKTAGVDLRPVTVAVIDVGFNLQNNEVPYTAQSFQFDFADRDRNVHATSDSLLHGDFVSQFVAAINNGARTNGVAATVQPGTFSILPLKMASDSFLTRFDEGFQRLVYGDDFRIAAALLYVDSLPANLNVKVVNMSLGYIIKLKQPAVTQKAISSLVSNGITVVAAAGNQDIPGFFSAPAGEPGAISVGATAYENNVEARAQFSNFPVFGHCMTISAPGKDVLVFDRQGNPHLSSGTSFASPMVAGLVALIKSIKPDISEADLVKLIQDNADEVDLGDDPIESLKGKTWKRINVKRTVEALLQDHPEWKKEFEGIFAALKKTKDGGFISAGSGNNKFRILKTDPNGEQLWELSFSSTSDRHQIGANDVVETPDGNFIAVGGQEEKDSAFASPSFDLRVVKINPQGGVLEDKVFEDYPSGSKSVATVDGGAVVVLYSKEKITLLKLDANITEQWKKEMPFAGVVSSTSFMKNNKGYVLAGNYYENKESYGFVLQLDHAFNELWRKTIKNAKLFELTSLSGGSFVGIAEEFSYEERGTATALYRGKAGAVYTISSDGNVNGMTTYGVFSKFSHAEPTSDGGCIIVGTEKGKNKVKLLKLDPKGERQWIRDVPLSNSGDDYAAAVVEVSPGAYVVAGNYVKQTTSTSMAGVIAKVNAP